MRVTIHQPGYWPYLGVFDKIAQADSFIFLDDVQFEKNEFKNRNRVFLTSPKVNPPVVGWITLPTAYVFPQTIQEVMMVHPEHHLPKNFKTLEASYGKLPGFAPLRAALRRLYLESPNHTDRLSEFCQMTMIAAMELLAITPGQILVSSRVLPEKSKDPSERLVQLCQAVGATEYLAGRDSKKYLDTTLFDQAGIRLVWHQWDSLKFPYGQEHQARHNLPFVENLSVLDFLFNMGEKSPEMFASRPRS